MLLNTLQCTGWSRQQRRIQSSMSVALRFRNWRLYHSESQAVSILDPPCHLFFMFFEGLNRGKKPKFFFIIFNIIWWNLTPD